jgi:hypothetical protein
MLRMGCAIGLCVESIHSNRAIRVGAVVREVGKEAVGLAVICPTGSIARNTYHRGPRAPIAVHYADVHQLLIDRCRATWAG